MRGNGATSICLWASYHNFHDERKQTKTIPFIKNCFAQQLIYIAPFFSLNVTIFISNKNAKFMEWVSILLAMGMGIAPESVMKWL